MASGTLGADDSREKHRWGEGNKVYTRKLNKGLNNKPNANPTAQTRTNLASDKPNATAATTTTVAVAATAPIPSLDAVLVEADNNKAENNENSAPQSLPPRTVAPAPEDPNSPQQRQQEQQQTQSRFNAPSDNSSSHNRPSEVATPNGREVPNGNGVVKPVITKVDDRVRINLAAASSKNELRELRRKLASELDQVRILVKRLEDKEVQLTAYSSSNNNNSAAVAASAPAGGAGLGVGHAEVGGGYTHSQFSRDNIMERPSLVRVTSKVSSGVHISSRPVRPPPLSVSVMDSNLNHHRVGEFVVEKEKRTPKANQYYQNSEFLLGKDRLPPESNKRHKSNGGTGKKHGGYDYGFGVDRYKSQVWKSCSNLLQRLMKHRHGWVFNDPVDAKALGLHDYHDIIKNPMDLGTIKCRLVRNYYRSPREFAEDVRLTFRNAMIYNPKGQDVHIMAEQLMKIFEERWAVIDSQYNPDWRYEMYHDAGLPTPTLRKLPPALPHLPAPSMRALERSESMTAPVDSMLKPPTHYAPVVRTPAPKKPKAKDPNKRDMTYEEKQRLSTNLQSLPSEKLDNIVQIIKKTNSALCQHDDEIEVDIDSVDAETLWELDRFVTNYKKSLSKHKRKAELALQLRTDPVSVTPATNLAPVAVEAPKETKTDKRNASSPVQGEKKGDIASRSSSSSSSSSDSGSSSSDSDSDSSSGSGSDAAQSPRN